MSTPAVTELLMNIDETRMHSSRMRTTLSSSRWGGCLHQATSPPGTMHPRGPCTLLSQDHAPHPHDHAPHPPKGPCNPRDHATPRPCTHPGSRPPPHCGQTHSCKHITLPQTSFAGGNETTEFNILYHVCRKQQQKQNRKKMALGRVLMIFEVVMLVMGTLCFEQVIYSLFWSKLRNFFFFWSSKEIL